MCGDALHQNMDKPSRMKILSLGLPKTGTASLAAAYRILGFDRVHHGIEATDDHEFWPRYERACEATFLNLPVSGPRPPPLTRSDWDTVWGPDIEAVVRITPAMFYPPSWLVWRSSSRSWG